MSECSVRVAHLSRGDGAALAASEVVEEQASLKLRLGLAFLDGKKLRPFRLLSSASFDGAEAHLVWPEAALRLTFAEAGAVDALKAAVEKARGRASEMQPMRAGQFSREEALPLSAEKAPRPKRASPVGAGPLSTREEAAKRRRASAEEKEDAGPPPEPIVDASLGDEDRRRRRALYAEKAEERGEAALQRGIGDIATAQRIRERSERAELLEGFALKGKDLPVELQGAPVAELLAHMYGGSL